ncbi:hypothetical protein SDC9_115065 [bioreactor metagenome]|jgi:hypothetical protein|uniref:Uncharacterized protein n=1 Tax=bioreactor metagenome TaxID=1076179 RepID=A0A645C2D2_9ZZZZ
MNDDMIVNRKLIKDIERSNDLDNNKVESKTNDFAAAFPKWDLMPPAVVVKRVRRKI